MLAIAPALQQQMLVENELRLESHARSSHRTNLHGRILSLALPWAHAHLLASVSIVRTLLSPACSLYTVVFEMVSQSEPFLALNRTIA